MAVASRLLPRSWGSLAATLTGLTTAVAGLALLDGYSVAIAAEGSSQPISWLLMDRAASITTWCASTLWIGIAMLSLIMFGLCRSRMDDLKSGYRWWLVAAATSVALSLNAATHVHGFLGELLAKSTGFAPLETGAFWWLVPGAVIFGAVAIRVLMVLSDSRTSLGLACLGMAAISASCIVEAGLMPQSLANVSPLLASPLFAPIASLAGASLFLLSLLFFSRRIVLEVEGVVTPPALKAASKVAEPKKKATRKAAAKRVETLTDKPSIRLAEAPGEPEPRRPNAAERKAARLAAKAEAKPKKEETSWVSGGDDYQDEYEEGPTRRKLSKSERKRLRKMKARNAA